MLALYPAPPPSMLPRSTVRDLRWTEANHESPAQQAARWMAARLDDDGLYDGTGPASASPSSMLDLRLGPVVFHIVLAGTMRRAGRGRAVLPTTTAIFPALAVGDKSRPFLWPFTYNGPPMAAHAGLSSLFYAGPLEALAQFLAAAPTPARSPQEARAGTPVLPWITPDLTEGPDGAQAMIASGGMGALLRAAWLEAEGAEGAHAGTIRISPWTWNTRGAWSWDRLERPEISTHAPWQARDDSPIARVYARFEANIAHLLAHPAIVPEPALWMRPAQALLWNGRVPWEAPSAHARLAQARIRALLADSPGHAV